MPFPFTYTLKFFSLQIRERELNDNLKYRAKLEEAEKCSKEVDQINSRLKGLDATKLNAQYTELTKKLEQLKNEVSLLLSFTSLLFCLILVGSQSILVS